MPKDHRIRFFYSIESSSQILQELADLGMITMLASWESGSRNHQRLMTFFREQFVKAVEIPEHPDYINALLMEDCAVDIRDPDTAFDRLLGNEFLYHQKDGIDLSDDRYLLKLPPVERYIASLVELHCAEYLHVKRNFFKELYVVSLAHYLRRKPD